MRPAGRPASDDNPESTLESVVPTDLPIVCDTAMLARILGTSTARILRLVRAGKLRPLPLRRRFYQFYRPEVLRFLDGLQDGSIEPLDDGDEAV